MSNVPKLRDAKAHEERALVHTKSGDVLNEIHDDWFAVCYFYAAYHLVKGALHADPIFDSLNDLQTISPKLTFEVKAAEHHSGGTGVNGRSLGINEAVFLLYKNIRVAYHRLHIASCHVRYGSGLAVVSAESVRDDFLVIEKAYEAGEIRTPKSL